MLFNSHLPQCLPSIPWTETVHVDKAPATRYIGDFLPTGRDPELWHEPPCSPAFMHFMGIGVSCKLGHTPLAVQHHEYASWWLFKRWALHSTSISCDIGLALHAGSSQKAAQC